MPKANWALTASTMGAHKRDLLVLWVPIASQGHRMVVSTFASALLHHWTFSTLSL